MLVYGENRKFFLAGAGNFCVSNPIPSFAGGLMFLNVFCIFGESKALMRLMSEEMGGYLL